jgi:hypothetical protein
MTAILFPRENVICGLCEKIFRSYKCVAIPCVLYWSLDYVVILTKNSDEVIILILPNFNFFFINKKCNSLHKTCMFHFF